MALRLGYAGWILAIVGFGLLLRIGYFDAGTFVTRWGGSALWGALILLVLLALFPNGRLVVLGFVAFILSAIVELSHLWHLAWVDSFRATATGGILLGRTFSWWDIVAYWVGIVVVWFADSRVR